jgi:hemerythrin-like domain-containing protein
MKSTDQLAREHKEILRTLDVLRSAATAWRNDPLRTVEDCRALLDFLRTFTDRCHHAKEEKVLFPQLIEAGIAMDNGPLAVMLYEHEQGRLLIRDMQDALDDGHPMDFALLVSRYAQLLQNHIEKEESILFVMAERVLTAADDASLLHSFGEIDKRTANAA